MSSDTTARSSLAGVDLNLLVALDALLSEHSVTRAGQRLSITQSSMSGALARLRGLFGDELLVRSGQTMRLTPFAETLQPKLSAALAQLEDTVFSRSTFDPVRERRTFTISATDYTSVVLFSRMQATFAAERFQVSARVLSTDIHGSIRRLEAGEIDLAILPANFGDISTLCSEPLFDDGYVAATWAGNPHIEEPLTYERLQSLPLLSYRLGPLPTMVERRLEELGVRLEAEVVLDSFVAGAHYLRGTPYVTFLQKRLVERLAGAAELRTLETTLALPTFVETMWWHPKAENDAAHAWFRHRVVEAARALP